MTKILNLDAGLKASSTQNRFFQQPVKSVLSNIASASKLFLHPVVVHTHTA